MIWKDSAQWVNEISAYLDPREPTSYKYETVNFT